MEHSYFCKRCSMVDFPPTAIELIARHLATLDGWGEGAEPDPRRYVLPLVSRTWRRALQLMPNLWGEVRQQRRVAFLGAAAAKTSCCLLAPCVSSFAVQHCCADEHTDMRLVVRCGGHRARQPWRQRRRCGCLLVPPHVRGPRQDAGLVC